MRISKLPRFIQRVIIALYIKKESTFWSKRIRKLFLDNYNIKIGYGTYGCFSLGAFPQGTVIGNYCSISSNVMCFADNHPYDKIIMHPIAYLYELGCVDKTNISRTNLKIGHGVWIGYGAIITHSCSVIGNGAVVGAGSIVTRDVPAYSIVAGNPAKVIKYRFSKTEIEKIEQSCWWNEDRKSIKRFIDYNDNVDQFLKQIVVHPR